MNEKFIELARRAALKFPSEAALSPAELKFAELIIRECMEQVRDEVQYEYDWKLADAVTKRVMEHFGVEE